MKITVYSKNACQPCTATKRKLAVLGLDYVEVNVDEQPEHRDALIARGFTASPVVDVERAGPEVGPVVESWSGYRPDLLEGLRA